MYVSLLFDMFLIQDVQQHKAEEAQRSRMSGTLRLESWWQQKVAEEVNAVIYMYSRDWILAMSS